MRYATPITAIVLAAVISCPCGALAQSLLQGPQGPSGDPDLVCDGQDCTLSGSQNLVVNGDVDLAGPLQAQTAVIDDTLDVTGQLTAGALSADRLVVTDRHDLPGCPDGYALDPMVTDFVLCYRTDGSGDEVVRVGDFWIDRYEVSVWDSPDCGASGGSRYGAGADDYDGAGFPDNGNWTSPLYACSIYDLRPSRDITWFQAQQACALSGKSLCTNARWQAAAAGTPDDTTCNVDHGGFDDTGENPGCVSVWGAADMVGNVFEWVALWEGHPGWNGAENLLGTDYGNDGYWAGGPTYTAMLAGGTDGSWRASSLAFDDGDGLGDDAGEYFGPAAALRGGDYTEATDAGVFALYLAVGPGHSFHRFGARCCLSR